MTMNAYYCTLDEAMREVLSKNTRNDAYLFGLLPAISRRLAQRAGRDFEPSYGTRTFIPNRLNVTPTGILALGEFLLELEAVSVGSTALVIGTDVDVYRANGVQPAKKLRLLPTCRSSVTWYGTGCLTGTYSSPPVTISVTGWWGYKEWYDADGWLDADAIQAAALTASATKFKVTSVSGEDPRGFTPRFSPGALIRIGDELMRTTKTNTSNEVTVLRAQRGTEAAEHAQGATVQLWNVEEDVRRAAMRWASLQYQRKGVFETARVDDAIISLPADIPPEVANIINHYDDGAGNF